MIKAQMRFHTALNTYGLKKKTSTAHPEDFSAIPPFPPNRHLREAAFKKQHQRLAWLWQDAEGLFISGPTLESVSIIECMCLIVIMCQIQ